MTKKSRAPRKRNTHQDYHLFCCYMKARAGAAKKIDLRPGELAAEYLAVENAEVSPTTVSAAAIANHIELKFNAAPNGGQKKKGESDATANNMMEMLAKMADEMTKMNERINEVTASKPTGTD